MNLKLISVSALSGLVLAGCAALFVDIDGSGIAAYDEYDFQDFQRIEASGIGSLRVTMDGQEGIRVEGDDNILDFIEVVQRGDRVIIRQQGDVDLNPRVPLVYYVSVKELEKIDMSGAMDGRLTGYRGENLKIDISGDSELLLQGEGANLVLDISGASFFKGEQLLMEHIKADATGASSIFMDGQSNSLDITASGASRVDSQHLQANRVTAEVSGASQLKVNAKDRLTLNVSGASSVRYVGQPAMELDISGASSISQID